MKPKAARPGSVIQSSHAIAALACVALLASGNAVLLAQATPAVQSAVQRTETPAIDEPKIPNDQLDSLVAPIALYPDPLLAQTLAASTYPLEIVQLQQWLANNPKLKDKALADAVGKQPWDPSIQSMAVAPDVVQRLASNIQWTTDLGNAFLAQQSDVMDAVQRMRGKAETKGTLKTSKQQTVETKSVEGGKQVIVIESADPQVVYVPSYDPAVIYGPPAYPYYPYTYPGYYPGMGLGWGMAGFALGAWAGSNWGNCNWGGGDININNNNNFNRNSNRNQINNRPAGGNKWQHNSNHRGPAPYSNRKTADKFGGNDRGGPNNNRPGGDRNKPSQQPNRPGGDRSSAKGPGGDRSSANRPSGDRSSANRPTTRSSGGDRVSSNRSVSNSPSRSSSTFSSGGGSRSSASSSFSRGSSSMGGSRGGGSHGGGSRGGGSRGGGRRR